MNLRVQPATPQDYRAVLEIYAEADALHADALPHLFRRTELPARSLALFQRQLDDARGALLVAELDGRVVGVIQVEIRERGEVPDVPALAPRRWASIEALAVADAFRRRGVATRLVEAAQRWVLDQGLDEVELTVHEFNQGAIRFYERMGYRMWSRRLAKRLE
jgi:ribosomal protein S18 acetylase RimI-like enzyme